jgi:hypothetical protein
LAECQRNIQRTIWTNLIEFLKILDESEDKEYLGDNEKNVDEEQWQVKLLCAEGFQQKA